MTGQTKISFSGGCLCGAVRYSVNGPMASIANCHCTQCQRIHGIFGAYSSADRGDLEFTSQQGLKWFRSSDNAKRGFCAECGASLFYDNNNRPYMSISAGTLDQPTRLQTTLHIFTDDKGDYYEISDDLPKCRQDRDQG